MVTESGKGAEALGVEAGVGAAAVTGEGTDAVAVVARKVAMAELVLEGGNAMKGVEEGPLGTREVDGGAEGLGSVPCVRGTRSVEDAVFDTGKEDATEFPLLGETPGVCLEGVKRLLLLLDKVEDLVGVSCPEDCSDSLITEDVAFAVADSDA